MLVQSTNNVMVIKIETGEEIICTVVSENSDYYEITNTLMFVMAFNPEHPTQGEVSFTPWMVGVEFGNTHILRKNSIVAISSPSSPAYEKYNIAINSIKNNKTSKPANPPHINNGGLIARK